MRRLLCVLSSLVLFGGCEQEVVYSGLHLAITADPVDPPIRRLVLEVRAPDTHLFSGATAGEHRREVPTNGDLVAPHIVQLVPGGRMVGRAHLLVRGYTGAGVLAASWSGVVDLGVDGERAIRLAVHAAQCDADADGFASCEVAGCCDQEALADCDDSTPLVSPFAVVDECIACGQPAELNCDGVPDPCIDADLDGYADCDPSADCDPTDPAVHRGAVEICDGKDNDCDGQTDVDTSDTDGDGLVDCADDDDDDDGVLDVDDCGPLDRDIYPGAPERCNDLDDDCDGRIDEGAPDCGWLGDWDGDGVAGDADCAPYDSRAFPGSTFAGCCLPGVPDAACDFDCDGTVDRCDPDDADGDGYVASLDCDDTDPRTWPGAPERCDDGIDQDCAFGDARCADGVDADADGFVAGVDCDDSDPDVHPWAPEVCNGRDDDCDGFVDGGNPGGGASCPHPDPARRTGICLEAANAGTLVCGQHLQRAEGALKYVDKPAPFEVVCVDFFDPSVEIGCDGVDDDCDGSTDEGFFFDGLSVGESCGVGECQDGTVVCTGANKATCTALSQATAELCDGLDNDCDGTTDQFSAAPSVAGCLSVGVCATFASAITATCSDGAWDCAYEFAAFEAEETRCDQTDNDCDGETDEDLVWVNPDTLSAAALGGACDGVGACGGATGTVVCAAGATACSANSGGTSEVCNGVDDDCDGQTDEGLVWNGLAVGETCDGIGGCGIGVVECDPVKVAPTCSTNKGGSESEATTEVCNGVDDDCNGVTDEGFGVGGSCSVGNGTCANSGSLVCDPDDVLSLVCDVTGKPLWSSCDDGDGCTYQDTCSGGEASACGGVAYSCDDGASCTVDTCDGAGGCDHAVTAGQCFIGGQCYSAGQVHPGQPCLHCDPGQTAQGWSPRVVGAACDDGNSCTTGDACTDTGQCAGAGPDCNDGLWCTIDDCDGDGCQHTQQAGTCLVDGQCWQAGDINPANACEICQGTTPLAWSARPDDTDCQDGDLCTTDDGCVAGACVGAPLVCDDDEPCTVDTCAAGSCLATPLEMGAACDDGSPCTEGDACSGGACVGAPVVCDDANPCTDDLCTEAQGCKFLFNGVPCDDGDACTVGDACSQGACEAEPKDCDDANTCTDDVCVDGDCTVAPKPDATACSDGEPCTTGDACQSGVCVGTAIDCEDGNPCTSTVCESGECETTNLNGLGCDDGDACTVDACSAGACVGTPKCDDGNVCTADMCSGGVCSNPAIGGACQDGNPCDVGDFCENGVCEGGPDAKCDDGLSCTLDVCKSSGSCAFPIDDNTCLIDGVCYGAFEFNPENDCERCDPTKSHTAWSDRPTGAGCLLCNFEGVCFNGGCVIAPETCPP